MAFASCCDLSGDGEIEQTRYELDFSPKHLRMTTAETWSHRPSTARLLSRIIDAHKRYQAKEQLVTECIWHTKS
jgi:hypothetical protein